MKEVIIVDGLGCPMNNKTLQGVVKCARERPKSLIILVNGEKGYDWRVGKTSGGKWMEITLGQDFGIENPIIVEENVKTADGAITRSREILEKRGLLEGVLSIIIFCQFEKVKEIRSRAEKVFKGKGIQVFALPGNH